MEGFDADHDQLPGADFQGREHDCDQVWRWARRQATSDDSAFAAAVGQQVGPEVDELDEDAEGDGLSERCPG